MTTTTAEGTVAAAEPGSTRRDTRRPALYPIAFPVVFVLNFWAGTNVDPGGIVRSLLVAVAVGLAVSAVASALAGRTRGGLAASAVLAGLLAPAQSVAAIALFAVALVVVVEGVVHGARTFRSGPLVGRVMIALASILLLAVAIKLVSEGALSRAVADAQLDYLPRGAVQPPAEPRPDIVVMMLDGYPGDAVTPLARAAGSPYDPEAFPAALTDLGFHVQRNSHSNYLLTPMTLASMLDMRHLVDVPGLTDPSSGGIGGRVFRRLADQGRALDILHEAGYELIWVDAGFSHIEIRRVDRWISPGMPTELEVRLLESTIAGRLLTAAAPDALSGLQRERVLTTIDDAAQLLDEPHTQPRFIFVHVPSPHAPWIFGPNGEPLTEPMESFFMDPAGVRDIDRSEAIRRVLAQTTYLSGRVTAAMRPIVDRPDPPVVVILSDHGTGTEIDFIEPATTDLVERSSNFLATFTPGRPHLFDDFTTPVNIFPTLFGGYLGMDLPRSADTIYAWSGPETNLFPVDVPGTTSR